MVLGGGAGGLVAHAADRAGPLKNHLALPVGPIP